MFQINISRTKQECSPRRDKDDIFLDVFDAKSSLESFLFRKTFSSKEFIGPKLLSSIPIQLVVELSKLHADADALPPRANPIEHDSKIPRIKRRSKVFCEKSLKRSHLSSKALKVESQSKPECFKKKHVMFADDCGKSLEHIRTIENLDEIGYNSFDDNYYGDYDSGEHENEREIIMTSLKGMRSFIPMYLPKYDLTQRQSKLDFQKVVLTELKTYGIMIVGVVAVVNLGFQKEVTLRYTTDDWKSFHDTSMTHLERGTGLPFYDQFCFEVHCRPAEIKNEVIFCIRFKCAFGEFWDNNSGKNYSLKLKKWQSDKNSVSTINSLTNIEFEQSIMAVVFDIKCFLSNTRSFAPIAKMFPLFFTVLRKCFSFLGFLGYLRLPTPEVTYYGAALYIRPVMGKTRNQNLERQP